MRALTSSGRSIGARCPQCGNTRSSAPGMPAAISAAWSGGVSTSPSPTATRVGTRIPGRSGRLSGPMQDRGLLPHERLLADPLRHRHDLSGKLGIGKAVRMQELRQQPWRDAPEMAAPRQGNQPSATARIAPRCRAARSCRTGKPSDALGRPAQHGESDVAAHREPASANRPGIAASARSAIASTLSSAVVSATVTGDIGQRPA